MRRLALILACLFMVFALSSTLGQPLAQGAAKYVIKISHPIAPTSPRHFGMLKMKEILEKKFPGVVKVEVYPASQLGSGREQTEGAQLGTIEIVNIPTAFFGGFQPLMTLLDLPFLWPDNMDVVDKVQEGPAAKALLATLDEIGLKGLGFWRGGFRHFTANKPLKKKEDFVGQKFRVMPSPILIEQFKALGASPITFPFSEVYSALQQGAVDGQENPINVNYDMKFFEVQKYMTLSGHGTMELLMIANKKWYDGLPEDIRSALHEAFEEGGKVCWQREKADEDVKLKKMLDAGIKVVELTPQERAALRDASMVVREFYVNKYGPRAAELLKLYEEEIAKAEKELAK